MKLFPVLCLLSVSVAGRVWPQTPSPTPPDGLYANIETPKGSIEATLDFGHAPLTVMNFVGLAEGTLPFQNRPTGKPFFDGLTFHRVVKDFVIQGGDPLSGDPATPTDKLGEGDPGYSFPDEFGPALRHDAAGVLSMANDGPDTNGSQFFITLREVNRLNYMHSVFGRVTHGLDVIERIEQGDKILHVTIRRVGQAAGAFVADATAFEALKKSTVEKRRPAAPGDFVYLQDGSGKLPDFRVKNFNYKLANYERATGHHVGVRVTGETGSSSIRETARTLGFADIGDDVLLVCSPADKAWKAWLGEATYPALMGQAGSTEALMANGVMHDKKTALLAPANAQLAADKLKESVDAAIDTVILALDDYALKPPAAGKP